jgi:ATP-binding cassette subfamily B protein
MVSSLSLISPDLCWPHERLGEVLETLTQRAGLQRRAAPVLEPPPSDPEALLRWMHFTAAQLGIEAEAVTVTYREVEAMLMQSAPAVIALTADAGEPPVYLALLRGGRRLAVLAPDLKVRRIAADTVAAAMRAPLTHGMRERSETLLMHVGIAAERRTVVHEALLLELLGGEMLTAGWLLRLPPNAAFVWQAWHARVFQPIALTLGAQIAVQLVGLAGWLVISAQALGGTVESAWLLAWGLLLFTALPLQLGAAVHMGDFSTRLGGLLKQRIIFGTLRLQPDALRHEGMGQFFSRVLDAEGVEAATVSIAFLMIPAAVQVFSAAAIFAATGHLPLLALLVAWLLLIVLGSIGDELIVHSFFTTYRRITHYLVEVMVGHRTRLAQQPVGQWHTEEDRLLDQYWHDSRYADRSGTVQAVLGASWLLVALAGLALSASVATLPLPVLLACLGGIMLAQSALQTLQAGLLSISSTLQALGQVRPVIQAAQHAEAPGSLMLSAVKADTAAPLLVARHLNYRYHERSRWAIRGASLTLYSGDRVLLEGPSGGGKTTLAALIAGLRTPASGLLLLRGADAASLGAAGWRERVVVAPQFHENHIFTETFAFNLLMGRRYPPTSHDLHEAAALCGELGLGDLLRRMPSGLQQMVGESGWQLSHGERSRVFIARALLQGADVIVLDESFGALDAETLRRALECAIRRARTLVVIAHP